jgi:hypothetical protein
MKANNYRLPQTQPDSSEFSRSSEALRSTKSNGDRFRKPDGTSRGQLDALFVRDR